MSPLISRHPSESDPVIFIETDTRGDPNVAKAIFCHIAHKDTLGGVGSLAREIDGFYRAVGGE